MVDVTGSIKAREAQTLLRAILKTGSVTMTDHAIKEMKKDNLTHNDVMNILRLGLVQEAEWENGAWRYQVRTQTMCAVIEFESDQESVVVTVWRAKR